jgi:glycogen synthase
MNVLMVASECFPLVKTGGLADVVGALSDSGWINSIFPFRLLM